MIQAHRPTWAEINLDNLAHNFHSVKNYLHKGIKYMAVVKADAYGHGAICCARRLEREGIDWFGVALPEEGIELRRAGIYKHILCLGGFWQRQETDILNYNLTPVIYRLDVAERFDRAARERNVVADIHLKLDSGMNRIGVRFDEFAEFVDKISELKNLKIDGLMTHFAAADTDDEFTQTQFERFNEANRILNEKNIRPTYRDLANSAATLAQPQTHGNMVRLGGALYGLWWDTIDKRVEPPVLKAVMSLKSRITLLKKVPQGETIGYSRTYRAERDSIIATVPIGYQDGLPRVVSNRGKVIINGKFVNIVGRVTMDWMMLDVTDLPEARLGDDVIVIGEQNDLRVTAEEIAEIADTISYEITCGIHRRVEHRIVGE